MRSRTVVTLLFCGFCLLAAGCSDRAGTVKPDDRAASAVVQGQESPAAPPSGEVQERAVPRIAPGVTAPLLVAPPPLPGEFAIMTLRNRTFLTAVGGGNRTTDVVHTDVTRIGAWERFRLLLVDPASRQYAMQTPSGNYLTAVNGGGLSGPGVLPGGQTTDVLHTDATQIQSWEKFWLKPSLHGWNNTIQTVNGNYLTATGGGGHTVDAIHTDATNAGDWEHFRVLKCGDLGSGYQYAIYAPNGVLFAFGGGGRVAPGIGNLADYNLRPNPYDDNWQRFRFLQQGDGSYAIQTSNGINYVTAIRGGGLAHGTTTWDNLVTDRTQVQAWEKFRLVDQGDCTYTIQTLSGYYLGAWSGSHTEYGAFSTDISDIRSAIKFRLVMFF